jgi:hypothetical protein
MKKKIKAVLEITSFAGISFDAEHYYGNLHFYGSDDVYNRIEISRTLGKRYARKLAKKDGSPYDYNPSETTIRFQDKARLINVGIAQAKEAGVDLLYLGTFSDAGPKLVAYGPDLGIVAEMNEIFAIDYRLKYDPPKAKTQSEEDKQKDLLFKLFSQLEKKLLK